MGKRYRVTVGRQMMRAGDIEVDADDRDEAREKALLVARSSPEDIEWADNELDAAEVIEVGEPVATISEAKASGLVRDIAEGKAVSAPFTTESFGFPDEFGGRQVVTHEVNMHRRGNPSGLWVGHEDARGKSRELALTPEDEVALRVWVDGRQRGRVRAHACDFEAAPCQQCERYRALGIPCIACSDFGEVCAVDGEAPSGLTRGECHRCGNGDLLFLYRERGDALYCTPCVVEHVQAKGEPGSATRVSAREGQAPEVVVSVRGGAVMGVEVPKGMLVEVRDFDVAGGGDEAEDVGDEDEDVDVGEGAYNASVWTETGPMAASGAFAGPDNMRGMAALGRVLVVMVRDGVVEDVRGPAATLVEVRDFDVPAVEEHPDEQTDADGKAYVPVVWQLGVWVALPEWPDA